MQLDLKQIGSYIQTRRHSAGLTQAQLGERLGVTAQSVSNWERGLILPDTASLPYLAELLSTTVDSLLAGGAYSPRFRRRMSVERIREAMGCIQRLRDILGEQHFMYQTMRDALDASMHSTIELAFQREGAMDAYICEALIACMDQGDYVDRDDVRSNIRNQSAAQAVLAKLDAHNIR